MCGLRCEQLLLALLAESGYQCGLLLGHKIGLLIGLGSSCYQGWWQSVELVAGGVSSCCSRRLV